MPTTVDAMTAFESIQRELVAAGIDLAAQSQGMALWSMDGEASVLARAGAARGDSANAWAAVGAAVVAQKTIPEVGAMLDALTFDAPYDSARWLHAKGPDFTCVVVRARSNEDQLEHAELVLGWLHRGCYQRIFANVALTPESVARGLDPVRLAFAAGGLPYPEQWSERQMDFDAHGTIIEEHPLTLHATGARAFDEVVARLVALGGWRQGPAREFFYEDHLSSQDAARAIGLSMDARVSVDVFRFESRELPSVRQMLSLRSQEGVADALADGLDAIELASGHDGIGVAFFQSSGGIADLARRDGEGLLYLRLSTDGYADDAVSLTEARGWALDALGIEVRRWLAHAPEGSEARFDDEE